MIDYLFALNDYNTNAESGRTPRELLQIWKDTFDVFYAEGATSPKMMA